MRKQHGRAALATATLLGLLTVLGTSPALAASPGLSGGIKGSPQPELKSFRIGPSTIGGSVAIEPDGSLVVAYGIASGHGKTEVCVLARGSHNCTGGPVTLTPLDNDTEYASTYAFVSSANHVEVIENDCCDSSSAGGDLLFTSTDGGHTFGAPVRIGSLGMNSAVLVGRDIVFTQGDSSSLQVESVPVGASGPPASIATAIGGQDAVDVGVANFRGGVLAAADDDGSPDTVRVAYARSGTNFDATSSYHLAGTFRDESLVGISGGALLTEQQSGRNALELRLFNGTSFGPAHTVPDTAGGGPEWFAVDQDPGGTVHVFNDSTHLGHLYELYQQTTTTGASWDSPVALGNGITATGFAAGLDRSGSGLVLGTPDTALGFPVLARQGITFSLSKDTVRKGRTVTGSGQVRAKAPGRLIELQTERSGLWYTVGTTHESASGTFRFTIRGNGTGTHQFRAVASDLAGYVMYGYSAARSLRVTS